MKSFFNICPIEVLLHIWSVAWIITSGDPYHTLVIKRLCLQINTTILHKTVITNKKSMLRLLNMPCNFNHLKRRHMASKTTCHGRSGIYKTDWSINIINVNLLVFAKDYSHGSVTLLGPVIMLKIAYFFCCIVNLIWYY